MTEPSETQPPETGLPPATAATGTPPAPRMYEFWAYLALAVVSLAYLALTFLAPVSTETLRHYSVSVLTTHILDLTVVLPIIAVWFIALWGSLQFKRYALSIYANPDGRALNIISNGLLTLVGGLAFTSLLQALIPKLTVAGFGTSWTIIVHHTTLVLALAAFALMLYGSVRLAQLVQLRGFRRRQWMVFVVVAAIGAAYALVLVHDPYRTTTNDPSAHPSYYLSDPWILGTVLVPYVVAWYCGLTAAVCLRIYQRYSPGVIYRHTLSLLSYGMVAIIVASVLIQMLTAAAASLSRLGLGSVLLVLYALIIIYGVGHVLVALGARRLSKIEEVR